MAISQDLGQKKRLETKVRDICRYGNSRCWIEAPVLPLDCEERVLEHAGSGMRISAALSEIGVALEKEASFHDHADKLKRKISRATLQWLLLRWHLGHDLRVSFRASANVRQHIDAFPRQLPAWRRLRMLFRQLKRANLLPMLPPLQLTLFRNSFRQSRCRSGRQSLRTGSPKL